jgi:hypothetical protein
VLLILQYYWILLKTKNLLPFWEGRSFDLYTLIGFEQLALSNELPK